MDKLKTNRIKKIARNYKITPFIVGKSFKVHTGKIFLKIYITDEMVGHKIGEFVSTREKFMFKKKRKTKKTN